MGSGPPSAQPLTGSRVRAGVLFGLVIAGIVALIVWRNTRDPGADSGLGPATGAAGRTPASDPRRTYATPHRNVRPEVKYVGDAACADCHADISRTYREHPMGRSLAPVAAASALERYDAAAHNPFEVAGFKYAVERRPDGFWHVETATDADQHVIAETAAQVRFKVGSGRNGRAYLIDHDGYLFTSPITWYPQTGTWALSPGYEKSNPRFARPVTPDCLFCHANYADHVSSSVNRYREPIFRGHAVGCERCHGPGELHVRERGRADKVVVPDDTIVNPARLEHSLRESVCQQCHLQGRARVWRRGCETFDYRPGLPFHLVMSEFVRPPTETDTDPRFVGAVEQMYASGCFRKGTGPNKMGCISCHDPHAVPAPAEKVTYYRDRCLKCHQDRGCSVPRETRVAKDPADNCVACHMPPTGSNINHTTITDHRILRRPEGPKSSSDGRLRGDRTPLVHFHRDLVQAGDPEVDRDLGIALIRLANKESSADVVQSLVRRALPLLEVALARDEEDLPAWEAKGSALWFLGRLDDAAPAYERALAKSAEQETTLHVAASLALRRGRVEQARSYAERAVKVNPWRWQYHQVLARACAQSGDWLAATRACREVLKLNAAELETRRLLVVCELRLGNRAGAQREFDTLMALRPPQPDELRRWFAELVR